MHIGTTCGFSAPQVADPLVSFRSALHVADEFAKRFQGAVFDEDGHPLTIALRAEYERNLNAAVAAFEQVGLVPGSAEALRLFGG